MSKTEDSIAWSNQKLYIRWRCIKDLGQFEEAHHWNIQAKFYNEKFPLVNESDNIGDSPS